MSSTDIRALEGIVQSSQGPARPNMHLQMLLDKLRGVIQNDGMVDKLRECAMLTTFHDNSPSERRVKVKLKNIY